jgi:hypothetical protein
MGFLSNGRLPKLLVAEWAGNQGEKRPVYAAMHKDSGTMEI